MAQAKNKQNKKWVRGVKTVSTSPPEGLEGELFHRARGLHTLSRPMDRSKRSS